MLGHTNFIILLAVILALYFVIQLKKTMCRVKEYTFILVLKKNQLKS